jgi:hypothetical protein
MLLLLAYAEVLPYDYVDSARTMRGYLPALESAAGAMGWPSTRVENVGGGFVGMV